MRIGNGAHDQLQLDVYGELMDAVYLSNKLEPISWELWRNLRRLLDWLADNWQQPDEGIWEVRGGRRDFVYSRLMCWVAFERAMRMQSQRGLPGDTIKWRTAARRDLRGDHDARLEPGAPVLRAVLRRRRARRQQPADAAGQVHRPARPADAVDARRDPRGAGLRQPRLPLPPEDAADDGLGGAEEGSFSLCSFWLVECLTRAGRLDEARLVFEKMLTYASNLGLFAEQVGDTGDALGNYPQAFTHLGLISAAWDLNKALGESA